MDLNVYNKVFDYDNVLVRFFWLVILLASLAVTGWVISWNITGCLEYGVTSQIGVVYEQPTQFPAVTFCRSFPFTGKAGQNFTNTIADSGICDDAYANG